MPQNTSYSEMIRVRAPDGFAEAIAEAAARDITTVSEFVRRAIVDRLRALGIDPRKTGTRDNNNGLALQRAWNGAGA